MFAKISDICTNIKLKKKVSYLLGLILEFKSEMRNIGEKRMETELYYKLFDAQSTIKSEGQAKAVLDGKYLTLNLEFGDPLFYSYTDFLGVSEGDYQINLFLPLKEKLHLSRLGYQYEDFLREFFRLRNELLLKYLLMEDKLIQGSFKAQYTCFDSLGQLQHKGSCELRIYETAVVVLPQKNEPIRIPYCYIKQVTKGDWKLIIIDDFGEKYEFTQMGENFDPFTKRLAEANSALTRRTLEAVKELVPEADPATVQKLAALLKDGKGAKKQQIESLSPQFWKRIVEKIKDAGLEKEYKFLESIASHENVYFGIKRGLMGALTGSYMWLLIPLYNVKAGKLGNAVAFEAFNIKGESEDEAEEETITEEDENNQQDEDEKETSASGKATYFFRLINEQDYVKTSKDELNKVLAKFAENFNRGMIDINFRREPIFLTEDMLNKPKYTAYRYAIAKMPQVKLLRKHFIGRVTHSNFDQWKSSVTNLLNFNSNSQDNTEKLTRK